MENLLDELFQFFEICEKIDFEEELVQILNDLIPEVQCKTGFYLTYGKNIEKLLDKTEFQIDIFFLTFYRFTTYGLD